VTEVIHSFYSREELEEIGFKRVGTQVLISRKASFYQPGRISIGDHVRIDDFCILSGVITLGSYIHLSAHCCLYGSQGIVMEDFSGLSPRVTVFSASDDFGGDFLIGPMVPDPYTHVTGGTIRIERYVQAGAGSVIFPGLTLHEGSVTGALSLVNRSLDAWTIYAGIPARAIRPRSRGLLQKVSSFLHDQEKPTP